MKNLDWLAPRWSVLEKQVHVDKVYLETFRDQLVPDEEALSKAKQFFESKGIKTAGGLATVRSERNHFQIVMLFNARRPAKTQGSHRIYGPAFRRNHSGRLLFHQLQVRILHQGQRR